MSITSVRFTEEIDSDLERAAAAARRTKSWLINEAVRDYLQRRDEEGARWRDTLTALDQVKHGELVDGTEVLEWLSTWGKEAPQKSSSRIRTGQTGTRAKRPAASRSPTR